MKASGCKYDLLRSEHSRGVSPRRGQELYASGSVAFKENSGNGSVGQEVVVGSRRNHSVVMVDLGVVSVSSLGVF